MVAATLLCKRVINNNYLVVERDGYASDMNSDFIKLLALWSKSTALT